MPWFDGNIQLLIEQTIKHPRSLKMSDLEKMSVEKLLQNYNDLAKVKGKPQLASWKQSKQGLITRFELLQDDSKPKTVPPPVQPEPVAVAEVPVTEAQPEVAPVKELQTKTNPTEKETPMSAKKASKKTAAKKVAAKKPAVNGGSRGQIGAFIIERINAGDSNSVIVEKVTKKFPDARTSYGSVASTRSRNK
jgi:CHASE2 domain-containing sensor protein